MGLPFIFKSQSKPLLKGRQLEGQRPALPFWYSQDDKKGLSFSHKAEVLENDLIEK